MGKDIGLNTGHHYIVGAKISRIHSKKEYGEDLKEFFVETSQSHESVKPGLIGIFKGMLI